MKLVIPDTKYKDSYIEALKDGFYLGSQSPKTAAEISLIESNFEDYLAKKVLKPYDPTPKLRDDGKYYVNSPQISF